MMVEPDIGGRDLILVTGASGFLGAAIASTARAAGYRVRVLIRSSSPRTNIHPHDQVVIGHLRDRESMTAALRGVRYLAHAAADYRLWAPSPDEILRNNVDGTRILMEEALRAGVERIVYTSSVATIALGESEPAD
jgi:dihydroflavonol-4-reductase